ncbi:hypothetical protein F6U93_06275 [Tamlana haliotis]|uniref:Uncharacterized protein n=1 Tax=Pseudotamlana haliotis TaxID=2614804 RepID=A0A6N6MEX8_9FLAO|nr:hypothetical protein [Tamlana haliotis]KAB1068304.1 hypothetical protein F6U93_06275 [Tamlana haliotis]
MKNLNKSKIKESSGSLFFRNLKLVMIICVMGCFLLTSCSEDDVTDALGFGGCDFDWEDEYEDALSDSQQAYQDFLENPTAENCKEYKAATIRFWEAIEDIYDCIPYYGDDYDDQFKEAKEELEDTDCDDL